MGTKNREECRGGEDCSNNEHMCKIAGRKDIDRIRDLVKDARYLCRKCGRAARSSRNLCKPVEV